MQSPSLGHHSHPFPVTPSRRTVDWADLVSDDSGCEGAEDAESCVETGSTHDASDPCSPAGSSSTPSGWSHGSSTVANAQGPPSLPGMAQALVKQLKAFETIASEVAVDQAKTQALKSNAQCNTELFISEVDGVELASEKLCATQSQAFALEASVHATLQRAADMEARRDAVGEQVQALAAEVQKVDTLARTTAEEAQELKAGLEEIQKELLSREASIAKQSELVGKNEREVELEKLRESTQSAQRVTKEVQQACVDAREALQELRKKRAQRQEAPEPVMARAADASSSSSLQQEVWELRTELDAPTSAGQRIIALQKRLSEAGMKTEALKASIEAESAVDEVASISSKMQQDVSQARTKELLAKVQKLRSQRDTDLTTLEVLRKEVSGQKSRCAEERKMRNALIQQVSQARADKDVAQREMHAEAAQVERLEKRLHKASESVTRLSSQCRGTSAEIEAARKASKQAECKEAILEWKLNKAIAQMQQQPHISSAARKLGRQLVKPLATLSRDAIKAKIAAKIPETGEDSDAASSCCTSTTCEPQSEYGGILN